MEFKSKIGLGEICGHGFQEIRGTQSVLCKVVAVTFDIDGTTNYTVEHSGIMGIQRIAVNEKTLYGDPDFDQVKGYEEKAI